MIVWRPNTIPDSVVTFLFDFATRVALGPAKGPEGLAACLLLLARLSNDLINRLKYYVPQLGDPNQDWVLGPS